MKRAEALASAPGGESADRLPPEETVVAAAEGSRERQVPLHALRRGRSPGKAGGGRGGFGRQIVRELRGLLRDPGGWLLIGLAPLLYGLFYPLPYLPEIVRDLPVVAVDADRTPLSRQLVRMADATEQVRVVATTRSIGEAEELVRQGAALGMLAIPRDFERDIRRNRPTRVAVAADAAYFLAYSQIATGLSQAAGTLSAGIEIRRLQAAGLGETQARAVRDPLPLSIRTLYNGAGGYGRFVVPSVIVLVLQQLLVIGLCLRTGSRRLRGLREALARTAVLVGAMALHAAILWSAFWPMLGLARRGDALALAAATLPFLLAAAAMGWLLAAFFRQRETALQILLPLSLPVLFLSGFSWPVESFPPLLDVLSHALPSTPAIAALVRIQQAGATATEMAREIALLWGQAVAYALLAWAAWAMRVRHRARR